MAISGILATQNHYNQRASGLWPTIVTPSYTPLATPVLFYTAPSTQSGSTTWTETRTTPTAVANQGPYGTGSTACELNINSPFIALELTTSSTTAFQPNSNDWYMDLWVYTTVATQTNQMVLWSMFNSVNYQLLFYDPNATSSYIPYLNIRTVDGGGVSSILNDTTLLKPPSSTWTHYGVQYDKTTRKLSLFKSGAYVGNTTLGVNGWTAAYIDKVTPLNWYAGYGMGGVWRFSNFRIGYGRRFQDGQAYSTTYSNLYSDVPAY